MLSLTAHAETHKEQSAKRDSLIENASFAEQQNAFLAKLKAGAVHMQQTTLLWLIRFVFHELALKHDPKVQQVVSRHAARKKRARPALEQRIMANATPPDVADAILSEVEVHPADEEEEEDLSDAASDDSRDPDLNPEMHVIEAASDDEIGIPADGGFANQFFW